MEKIYTIRKVPDSLHRRWKEICVHFGISMNKFALDAITEKVEQLEKERDERHKNDD